MVVMIIVLVIFVAIPVFILFLSRHLDSDFTLHVYENILGQKPDTVLRGKVVWITGASSGIGEHLAYKLVECGCKLVLSARRQDELARVMDQCAAVALESFPSFDKQNDIMVLPLDVKDFHSHQDLVKKVLRHFNKIDVLVNNAAQAMRCLVERTPFELDREIIDINLLGAISLTKAVLPHMIERKQGHIAVTSSFWGKCGAEEVATYSACKFALLGYFESLRLEVSSRNIKILTILPGPVKTNITPNALTGNQNIRCKDLTTQVNSEKKFSDKMSPDRCAHLVSVALANSLSEVWIGPSYSLKDFYLAQYAPSFYRMKECWK